MNLVMVDPTGILMNVRHCHAKAKFIYLLDVKLVFAVVNDSHMRVSYVNI